MPLLRNLVERLSKRVLQHLLSDREQLDLFVAALLPLLSEHLREQLEHGFDEHHLCAVQPEVDEKIEYPVFECLRPVTAWVFVDLSNAREGDEFAIKSYVRVGNGDFKLHGVYILEHQQAYPIATLTSLFAPAYRLTLAQQRGISKKITVQIFARYEDARTG